MKTANRITSVRSQRKNGRGSPVWEIARFYPLQGEWTEEEYLELEESSGNQLIELVDGFLEFLPMPDAYHQRIVKYMTRRLDAHADEIGAGEALFAPLPVRLWPRHMREPDIFFAKSSTNVKPRTPPQGADLVMEVVSPGKENRKRDLTTKRRAYARAKIPEYWIIDPEKEQITVLTLNGKTYRVHGVFTRGDQATSKLLPGFSVDVSAVFDAGEGHGPKASKQP